MEREPAQTVPFPSPRRQATWVEAVLIAALAVFGLLALVAGAFVFVHAVPDPDRYGYITGLVPGGGAQADRSGGSGAAIRIARMEPVAELIVVSAADDGHTVATVRSAGGRFALRLPPGRYELKVVVTGESAGASVSPALVDLRGGEHVTARVLVDATRHATAR